MTEPLETEMGKIIMFIIGFGLSLLAYAIYRLFTVPEHPATKEKNKRLYNLDNTSVTSTCCGSQVKVHIDSMQRYFYCEQCHLKTYDTGEPTFSGGTHEV